MLIASRNSLLHTHPAHVALPSPHRIAMFLDIDGTLLDIAPHPGDVIADAELIQLISDVCTATSGAVAFVSGRAIADIDRIFAPLVLPAAGLHGAELRYPDGSRFGVSSDILDHARPQLREFVEVHTGLLFEDKGATIAVHYRQRPDLAEVVFEKLCVFGASDALEVIQGKCVVELKPSLLDKGTGIARLLEVAPFRDRQPVFIGDDRTDEDGFMLVNERHGISVRIGATEEPSAATTRLSTPSELRTFLSTLIASTHHADAVL